MLSSRILAIAFLFLCSSASSYASNTEIDGLFGELPNPNQTSADDCANLSGTWVGSCTYTNSDLVDTTYEETIEIQQIGCGLLSVAGKVFRLDGVGSTSSRGASSSATVTNRYRWSTDRQKITTSLTFDMHLYESGRITHQDSRGSISFCESKLCRSWESTIQTRDREEVLTTDITSSTSCTYDLQMEDET